MDGAGRNGTISRGLPSAGEFIENALCLYFSPDDKLQDIVRKMKDSHIYAALVIDKGGLVGLVSERSIIHALVRHMEGVQNIQYLATAFYALTAEEVMSGHSLAVRPDASLEEALQIMLENGLRHLPVMDEGKAVGMLNVADIVECMERNVRQELENKDMVLSYLMNHENYGRG